MLSRPALEAARASVERPAACCGASRRLLMCCGVAYEKRRFVALWNSESSTQSVFVCVRAEIPDVPNPQIPSVRERQESEDLVLGHDLDFRAPSLETHFLPGAVPTPVSAVRFSVVSCCVLLGVEPEQCPGAPGTQRPAGAPGGLGSAASPRREMHMQSSDFFW